MLHCIQGNDKSVESQSLIPKRADEFSLVKEQLLTIQSADIYQVEYQNNVSYILRYRYESE